MPAIKPLPPLDPAMDASRNHYWTYHSLDTLLACKKPLTAAKDEDLFIAVHQICELAFHQMIIDLGRTLDAFRVALGDARRPIGPTAEAVYFLERVNRMWSSVNATMPILTTMRAFAEFRTSIGPTSGFQSAQFRRLEIMSGIRSIYWQGATADAAGKVHVAESMFDEVYGDQINDWFAAYADHSLKTYCDRLLARADLSTLQVDRHARPLLRRLQSYDRAQLAFHRLHLGLAVSQLKKVGVAVGTGGTSPRTYLAKYETLAAPLFPELAG